MKTKNVLLNRLLSWIPVFPLATGLVILFYGYLLFKGTCSQCSALLSLKILFLAGSGWILTGILCLVKPIFRASWLASILLGTHAGILILVPAPPCLYCILFFVSESLTTVLLVGSSYFELQNRILPALVAFVSFGLVGAGTALFLWTAAPSFVYPGSDTQHSPVVYVVLDSPKKQTESEPDFHRIKQRLETDLNARVFRLDPGSTAARTWKRKHNLSGSPMFIVFLNNKLLLARANEPVDAIVNSVRRKIKNSNPQNP